MEATIKDIEVAYLYSSSCKPVNSVVGSLHTYPSQLFESGMYVKKSLDSGFERDYRHRYIIILTAQPQQGARLLSERGFRTKCSYGRGIYILYM